MTSNNKLKLENPGVQPHNPFVNEFRPFIFSTDGEGFDARRIYSWYCFDRKPSVAIDTTKQNISFYIDYQYKTESDCRQRVRQLMKQTLDWIEVNERKELIKSHHRTQKDRSCGK